MSLAILLKDGLLNESAGDWTDYVRTAQPGLPLIAFCESGKDERCGLVERTQRKRNRKPELVRSFRRVRKEVERSRVTCPDCGSALIWEKEVLK